MFLCAAAVSHRPGQGLLGSLIFPRHMVRLILAGCETWVSHRHVLGWWGCSDLVTVAIPALLPADDGVVLVTLGDWQWLM